MYIKTSMPLEHVHIDLAIGRPSRMNNLRIGAAKNSMRIMDIDCLIFKNNWGERE